MIKCFDFTVNEKERVIVELEPEKKKSSSME